MSYNIKEMKKASKLLKKDALKKEKDEKRDTKHNAKQQTLL